jgi:hypothetical protein
VPNRPVARKLSRLSLAVRVLARPAAPGAQYATVYITTK